MSIVIITTILSKIKAEGRRFKKIQDNYLKNNLVHLYDKFTTFI